MTLSEFKAWFEGFTDNMDGQPTAKQWKKIQKRVSEIDGDPITERIFIDRYWPTWPRYPYYGPVWYGASGGTQVSTTNAVGQLEASSANYALSSNSPQFDSGVAMLTLGKTDHEATV